MELEGFCRGCLIKYDDPSALIQYSEKNRRLYVYSTGLQVKRNDLFTFQLCKGCYTNMKLSCRFKKQCRGTDKKFRQYTALKETGTNVDFCSFLKTNDDEFPFRLPLSGSSTPLYQKTRDDDNDSTCTSIRNFMTDILTADEIADTEARIIKEVIEEETDVLDDSLDSVWLQDDMSVDDSRLDFSFSPFSTPKASNEERFDTSQKFDSDKEIEYKESNIVIEIVQLAENAEDINEQIPDIGFIDINVQKKEDILIENGDNAIEGLKGFYVENETIYNKVAGEILSDLTIDKNLEQSLKENRTEYTLEELLNTPKHYSCNSGASTPTINNILFGEKLDFVQNEGIMTQSESINIQSESINTRSESINTQNEGINTQNEGINTQNEGINTQNEGINTQNEGINTPNERFQQDDDDIEIFEELFQDTNPNTDTEHSEEDKNSKSSETDDNIDKKYNEKDFICNTCNKKFKSRNALKFHALKVHNDKIFIAVTETKVILCPLCGASIKGYSNYTKHKKVHHSAKTYKCRYCNIIFTSQTEFQEHNKYTFHQKPKTIPEKQTAKTDKCEYCDIEFESEEEYQDHKSTCTSYEKNNSKLECDVCGRTYPEKKYLNMHIKSHARDFGYKCDVCHLAFHRKGDLNAHMICHTGVKDFKCALCNKAFSRKDNLFRHMKSGHNDKPEFRCAKCGLAFKRLQQLRKHEKASINCVRFAKKKKKDKDMKTSPTVIDNAVFWPNGLGLLN